MVGNHEFLTLKFILINEGKSNKSCQKYLLLKTSVRITQKKASRTDLIKKRPDAVC